MMSVRVSPKHIFAAPALPVAEIPVVNLATATDDDKFISSASPTPVKYSTTVGDYPQLLAQALDAVTGSNRVAQRAKLSAATPTYKEMMDLLHKHGVDRALILSISNKVLAGSKDANAGQRLTPQRLMLMSPIGFNPSWLQNLDTAEQTLIQYGQARIGSWLDLYSAVTNGISMALFKATEGPTFDTTGLPEPIRPIIEKIYQELTTHWQKLRPANRYWAAHPGVPYEPQERPISTTELALLKYQEPELYQKLMDAAPIPKSLPVLDAMPIPKEVDLSRFEIVMIQHALGSLVPFVDKLMQAGAKTTQMTVVPVASACPLH